MGKPVIPVGRNITVVITDNSQIGTGMVAAMNEVELFTLEKLDKQVQDYCNNNESNGYSPRYFFYIYFQQQYILLLVGKNRTGIVAKNHIIFMSAKCSFLHFYCWSF